MRDRREYYQATKEDRQEYYQANKEYIKKKSLAYYHTNKEIIKKSRAAYYAKYYADNIDKIRAARKLYKRPKVVKNPRPKVAKEPKAPAPIRVEIAPLTQEPKFNFVEASHIISFS